MASIAVLALCTAIYLLVKPSSGPEPSAASSTRIAQFKKLLKAPIAPEDVKRSRDLIYAMGNERQVQELVEVIGTLEAMRVTEPQLWGALGFVLKIGISNIHREDMEWRWRWVRQSLVTLRKGVDVTGEHLDLAYDLALNIQLTAESGEVGQFETALISRFESDAELQRTLLAPGEQTLDKAAPSPFVLAMGWRNYVKSRILSSQDPTGHTTKDGIRVTPVSQEASLRALAYAEGMYQWQRMNYPKAIHWLTVAEDKCNVVLQMDPQVSPAFKKWKYFSRDLRSVVLLDERASDKGLSEHERRALLDQAVKQAEALLSDAKDQQARNDLDWGYVQAFIGKRKQALR